MSAPRKKVVVEGPFDDLRSRDIRFLEEAAKLGDVTALVWTDAAVDRRTGRAPKFTFAERSYFLGAIRHVSRVVPGEAMSSEASQQAVKALQPDIWAVDEHTVFNTTFTFCERNGIQYPMIPDDALKGFPEVPPPASAAGRKKVIVTGCYDWFHSGHVRFFEEASAHGDLYVVVGHDANIRLLKGVGRPLFPAAERRYIASSIRFVKQALVSTGDGWLDAEPEIQRLKPDIYLVNEDGDVPEKREYCAGHGLQYVVLKRIPAPGLPRRSSTNLRTIHPDFEG